MPGQHDPLPQVIRADTDHARAYAGSLPGGQQPRALAAPE
jgi:hypothetical protein